MRIRRDFELNLDGQKFIDYHGEEFDRLLKVPGIYAQLEGVLKEALEICRPAACYDVFAIERFLHDSIQLTAGMRLGGGPVVSVMGGAEELVVAVCTVGARIDARIKAYAASKERFKMIMLDELASWVIDQIRLQLYAHLADEYACKGWHTSTCLSPGESAWSVGEQRKIFQLLDASQIGVSLSHGLVMSPLKSLSLIVGAGRRPMAVEGLTNCDYCSLQDRCRYSRMRDGS